MKKLVIEWTGDTVALELDGRPHVIAPRDIKRLCSELTHEGLTTLSECLSTKEWQSKWGTKELLTYIVPEMGRRLCYLQGVLT